MERKSKGSVFLQAMVLVCYLSMSILYISGELGWKSYKSDITLTDWFKEGKQLLQCLFAGVVIYAIPYEYLLQGGRYYLSEWLLVEEWDETMQAVLTLFFPAVFYACAFLLLWDKVEPYPLDGRYDMVALCLTLLFAAILMGLTRAIRNSGIYTAAFLLLLCIHSCVVTQLSGKYVLAVVLTVAMVFTWILVGFYEKSVNIKEVFATVITMPLFFIKLAEWTGRDFSFSLLLDKISLCSGRVYLDILKERGKVYDLSTYIDYGFTMMYDTHGKMSIVLFFCFFIMLSIASLYGSRKLFRISKKRGGMVLLIYMMFACAVAYGLLQELGILPISALRIMKNEFNIPLMFFAFRMFDNRKTLQNPFKLGIIRY